MEIGWAIDKGFEVLKTSYQVYKAFNDPHSNAPQQFRDLSSEFSTFHIVFSDLLDVLKQHNKPILISLTSIEFSLKKCQLFQQKFGVLNEVTTKSTIKQGLAKGFRTLQWSFLAENVANELRKELASHSRILSLYAETLNLRNALEDRVENHEIREQNREILRVLQQKPPESADAISLHLPDVPRYEPRDVMSTSVIDLPEVPRHSPQAGVHLTENLQDLDTACRELEALERFLETEGRMVDPVSISGDAVSSPRMTANFINLARNEVELRLERVNNYQKRMQNMLHRSDTLGSVSTINAAKSTGVVPGVSEMQQSDSTILFDITDGDELSPHTVSSLGRDHPTRQQNRSATGLSISVPIEQASLGSPLHRRQNSIIRRGESLPDDASRELVRYIERFEKDLDELDQFDIDGQIQKTRAELFELIQKSLPASPDLRLSPIPTINSPQLSPNIGGLLSASPPSSIAVALPPTRRDTLASIASRRVSIAGNQWQSLAKDVHIDSIPYDCAKCSEVKTTVLQVAQRQSGGLCFRLLCVSPTHKLSDGLLFRHDLSSSVPAYPHVYHTDANPGAENHVRVLGLPSRLEACSRGQQISLKVHPSLRLCYKFASAEDSLIFQQSIRGASLLHRFDVDHVTSSEYTSNPTRHVVVRVWDSIPSGTLSLMVHTSLVDRCDPFPYIESPSSFASITGSGTKVKLKVADTIKPVLRHKRANSRDSGVSGISAVSDDGSVFGVAPPPAAAKIKWIEIKFRDSQDKETFLRLWRGEVV